MIYLLQVADPMDKYRGDIENIINISGLNTSSVMEKTEFVPAIGKGYAQRFHWNVTIEFHQKI